MVMELLEEQNLYCDAAHDPLRQGSAGFCLSPQYRPKKKKVGRVAKLGQPVLFITFIRQEADFKST